jgi:FtsH-binding integral membrane protein
MVNPNFGTFNRAGTVADQASFDVGLRAHMVRVYNYMASGLALSGIVAFGLFSSPELAGMFFQLQSGRVAGSRSSLRSGCCCSCRSAPLR